jgi:hypothetical protein
MTRPFNNTMNSNLLAAALVLAAALPAYAQQVKVEHAVIRPQAIFRRRQTPEFFDVLHPAIWTRYSRRQLFANAFIAASRVGRASACGLRAARSPASWQHSRR